MSLEWNHALNFFILTGIKLQTLNKYKITNINTTKMKTQGKILFICSKNKQSDDKKYTLRKVYLLQLQW